MHVQRVRHLNCGSFAGGTVVTHVFLCETDTGLVLVDAGRGSREVMSPVRKLGLSGLMAAPALKMNQTAIRQVEALGWQASDVTDIVITHLDLDHIGGLDDFPDARIHVSEIEVAAARRPVDHAARQRYRSAVGLLDAAGSKVTTYGSFESSLLGLVPATPLIGCSDISLIPLPGHTRGHVGVAVLDPLRGWLIHAGDAYMDSSVIDPAQRQHKWVRRIERLLSTDTSDAGTSAEVLRALAREAGVFCSHSKSDLVRATEDSMSRSMSRGVP